MSSRAKIFFEQFFIQILCTTIWGGILFVSGLISTTGVFIIFNRFLARYVPFLAQYKWLFIIVFASIGTVLFMTVVYRFNKRRPAFQNLDFDFRVLERELIYKYKSGTSMVYNKKAKVQALKNNLDRYTDKYCWTGRGKIVENSVVKEHVYRESRKKNVWQFYEILFQKSLKRGDIMETDIQFTLNASKRKPVPFLSSSVLEPTDLLVLKVVLPPSKFNVKEAECEVSCSIGAHKPFSTQTIDFGRDGVCKWVIKYPKILYHYEMSWVF